MKKLWNWLVSVTCGKQDDSNTWEIYFSENILSERDKIMKKFLICKNLDQHNWNHMHDCILHATWNTTKKKSTKEELVEIFNKLPYNMIEDAYEWGMSDTLWRDKFIEWYEENYL